MIKIQAIEESGRLTLLVEGRIAGVFVPELANSWLTARAAKPDRTIAVDLGNVTCIDRAGRQLLHSMHADGVKFLHARMALQDIVEQAIGHC